MTADEERVARVAWNVVAEPGDPVAVALVAALGAVRALAWARWAVGVDLDRAVLALRGALQGAGAGAGAGARVRGGVAVRAGDDPGVVDDAGATVDAGARNAGADLRAGAGTAVGAPDGIGTEPSPFDGPAARRVLGRALARWAPRLVGVEPSHALEAADRIGCRLLLPGDPEWPVMVDDLDGSAPLCLWVRGPADLRALTPRAVALVGARAATAYGEHVAADLAAGVADAGGAVVSGGAYGIDVAAHRGALAAGGATVALLAGGVDRTYPAGNHDLLEHLACEGGAVVAECPPGTAPVRARFLLRNRLIAALSRATVVVEAAWRSGALSTATHATSLLRPLGAVPGPVTSMASAGCHRLIRDGAAVCVTSTADALELAGGMGGAGVDESAGARRASGPSADRAPDDLGARVLDAVPLRGAVDLGTLARRAGLAPEEVEASLGVLELAGLVRRREGLWSMVPGRR